MSFVNLIGACCFGDEHLALTLIVTCERDCFRNIFVAFQSDFFFSRHRVVSYFADDV